MSKLLAIIRIRYSLKMLLVALTAICIAFGLRWSTVRQRLGAISRLENAEAKLFDHRLDYPGPDSLWIFVSDWLSLKLDWPKRYFGQWASLDSYEWVVLVNSEIDDEVITALSNLSDLRHLKILSDSKPAFQPALLSQLQSVRTLILGGDWVTASHLEAVGSIGQLELLSLLGAKLQDSDLAQLRRLRPKLNVSVEPTEDFRYNIEMYERKK